MARLWLGIWLYLWALSAWALTQQEADTLKIAILAEPSVQTCVTNGDDVCVANWLNSSTPFIVWRTSVSAQEYHDSAIVWTTVDGMTAGKRAEWEWLSRFGILNPSKSNIRAGFADAFSNNATAQANLLAVSKRNATQAERILATGTGMTANPGLLTFEGSIGVNDISFILRRG
jgi:hypothetical protein